VGTFLRHSVVWFCIISRLKEPTMQGDWNLQDWKKTDRKMTDWKMTE